MVLPVANFDAYFGTTSFGRKYLKQIPEAILERSESGFGLCRYRSFLFRVYHLSAN